MRGCRQLALLIWKNLRFQTRNHYVFIMLQIGCPLVILLWFVWVKIILPIKSLHPVVEEKSSPIIQTFVKSREHKLLRVGYAPATELTCFIITLMRDTIKSKNIPNHLVSFIDFETEKKLIKTVSNKVLNKNVDVSIIFNVFNESAHEFFSNNTVEDRSATDSNCRSFPGHRPGLNRTLQDVLKSLDVTIRPSVSLKTAAIWSAGSMLPKRKAVCDEDAMADHVYQGVNLLLLILMESLINQVNPAFPTLNLSTQGIQCMIAVEHPIQWLLKIVMPLMLSVSVFPAITTIFYDIAREKERRTQQVLQMMGVSRMIYHLSWAISTLCQTLLIVAVVTGMQFLPDPLKILTKSDPTVVFLLFLVYGLTLAATALLATSICLKAKTAVTAFALYNLAQTIPVIYSGYYCESIGRTERFVFSWLYLCALQFGCCSIVRFEMTGEGVNWENIFRPATKYDNFSVGASILMMVSCATVFVLLTILITTDCWHHCLCGVHVVAKKAYNQMTHRRHTRLKKGRKKNDEDSQDDHIDRNDPGDSRLIEPSNSTAFVQFDHVTVRDVRRPHALYDVYMKIHKNQTTVLLGHSPSGKSYIVKVITGIVHPSHGSVTVNGLPLQKCIQNQSLSIGFCPKYNYLFKLLSVKENVRLFLGLQRDRWKVPVTEVDEIVELSNLSFQHSISVGRLSQASVRLLAVTLACYKDTQLIILEDPTYGLSETQAGHLLHTLKRMLIGRTTLITSSTAMVASCLAQKIGVFTNGKLLCFGSTDYVMELFGAGYELEIHCTSMCGMESLTNYMMLLIPNLLLLESSSKKMTYFLPETSTVKFEYLLSNLKMRDKDLEIVDFHINCITMEELFTRMTDENTLRSHFMKYVCHRQSLDTFSLGSALDVAVSRPRVLYSILCRTPSGIFNPFKSLCPDEYSRSCDQHGHSNTLTSVLLRAVQTDEAMGFFTPPLGSQVDDVGRELDSRLNRIFQSDTLRPRTPSEKFGNNKTAKFKAFLKPLTPVCPSKKWDDRISGKRNKNINAKKCLFSGDNISNDQLFETEFTVGGSSRSTKRRKSSMPVDGQPEQRFESCKDQKDKQCQTLRHQNVPSKFSIKSEIYADRRRRKDGSSVLKTINPFSKVPQKSKSYEKQQCGKGHCKSQKHTVSCLASPRTFCLRNTKIRSLGPFKRTGRSLAREDEPYALVNKGNISYNRHENSSLSVSKTSTQLNVSWNEETTVNICRNSMDDQGYAKSLRLRLLLAERMEPGMCMSLTKFWGLLVQKALYSFRACTVTCLQLFLPVCLLIIGLTLYRKENLIQEKKIVLDSSHLQDTTVIYVNDSKEIHVREVIETYKDILKGSSETQHPRVIERSRLPVSRNLQIPGTSYGLDDILIGAKFSSQATGSKPSLNLTAYYSLQAYHSEPLSIAMIMKTLQRYDQPDNNQTVSLSLQPLPLTHFDLFKDQFEQTHNHCCWIATTVVISLTSAISMFAVLPIKERMSGWKHLRSLSGVSSFLNLTSSLLWDLLICGLACLLILLTLIFWERATFEDTAFLYLFILVSDGMAGLFMIYTVQQIFQNPAHCVLLMFVTSSFIVSAFLLLTAHTWENVFESSRKSYLSDYKLYFTSLFPFCHLLLSLYGILLHAEKETFCYPLRKVCSVPTITCKSICKELVPHRKAEILEIHFSTMLLGTFVWAAVCFIVDKNLEYTPGKLKPETKQTEEEEDSVIADPHVAAEKMRVNQESFDARECLLLKNISRNQNGLGQLKGVSIAIAKGERFCLLGSKLSGKTALLEILTGKYRPWIGTILYNLLQKSETSSKTLLRIGYCPQKPVLMNELTGRETLVLYARLNGTPLQSLGAKVNELLETLHMLEVADKLCGDYRPSDRKMLSLAIALISNPHLLVLDEPTMNMDIVNSYRIWNILSNIQLDQGVLFLATSNTEECAVLCKRVGILANGRLLSLLPLDVLESRHATGYTCIVFFKNHDEEVQKLFFASVTDAFFGAQIIGDNDSAHIHFADDETNLAKLFSLMEDGKAYFNVERYMVQKTSLNHVMYFLSVCPDVEYFEAAPEASPSWTYWPPERSVDKLSTEI